MTESPTTKYEPELTVKLWLWKNGDHFWAFQNLYPCHHNGDPKVLGEPIGYAVFMPSVPGRPNP